MPSKIHGVYTSSIAFKALSNVYQYLELLDMLSTVCSNVQYVLHQTIDEPQWTTEKKHWNPSKIREYMSIVTDTLSEADQMCSSSKSFADGST